MWKALSPERHEIFIDRFRRIPEASSVVLSRRNDPCRRQIQQMQDEFIRMLRLDSERLDRGRWEISDVDRHDDIGVAAYRRGQHMPVIRIGKLQAGYEILIARDYRVRHVLIH